MFSVRSACTVIQEQVKAAYATGHATISARRGGIASYFYVPFAWSIPH